MTAAATGDFWLNGWGTALADDISETWTGTNGAAWPSQWTSQVGSTIQSNTGQLVTAATAYTGAQAYRTPGLLDGDLTVRTQVTGTTERYHSVYFRYTNAGNSGYAVTLYPNGVDLKRYDSGAQTTLSTTPVTLTAAWYKIRIQWQGNVLRAKVWLDTNSEPGSWMVTATDDTYGVPGAVQLQVLSGAAATAITGAFDDLAVHDLNTSPATTPTQVLGMTATSGPGAVTIRWTPQLGATGYNIYRAGTLIGTAPVQSQKVYTDSTGTVGTSYSYTVTATNTAGEGPPSVAASASSSTYTAWSAWTTARDARATANADVLFIGDSITEGQGASTKANRWQDLVVGKIRTAYPTSGVTGGAGYLPAFYGVYSPDSPWQSATTVAPGQWWDLYGSLGYRSSLIPVAGASATFTVFGTAIDIWSAGPGGTMTYQVDGGSVISVNQATHTAGTRTRVTFGGAAASHNVIIDCSAGTTLLGGWTVYNGDETVGIVPYDSARSGYRTSHFVAATAADYAGQILAWKAVAPDLVFLGLGINDYTNAVTVAQIKANLLEIIDAFKQFPKVPTIVLVGVYEFNGFTASNGDTWAGYINMLKAIQAADPAVVAGVADLYADMGTSSAGGFWSSDALHPSDTGHAHMADTIYAALPSSSASPVSVAVPAGASVAAGTAPAVTAGQAAKVAVTVPAGAVVVTGTAPTINAGQAVKVPLAVPAGAVAASGTAPGVNAPVVAAAAVPVPAGALTAAGTAPTVVAATATAAAATVTVPAGAATAAGTGPVTAAGQATKAAVTVPAGVVTASSTAPGVVTGAAAGVPLAVPAGAATTAGTAPTVVAGQAARISVTVPAGAAVLGAVAPTVQAASGGAVVLNLAAGLVTITGTAPTVTPGQVAPASVTVPAGALVASSSAPTVTAGQAARVTVTVPAGAALLEGTPPAVQAASGGAVTVTVPAGSVTITGAVPTVTVGRSAGVLLAVPGGTVTITGTGPDVHAVPIGAPAVPASPFTAAGPTGSPFRVTGPTGSLFAVTGPERTTT